MEEKNFKAVYWLEGEEDYYMYQVINYAEHNILMEAEAEFNLTIFYGRDADWTSVINACRRYPMFAERQVVVLKEAQHMKDIDKLESYIATPLATTILVVGYKAKGVDKRTKLYKILQTNAEVLTTKKLLKVKCKNGLLNLLKTKGLLFCLNRLHYWKSILEMI